MLKNGSAKECSNYCTIALISHSSKVMLKILQARLQQYMNQELPDVQADIEKAEEPEIKLPTFIGSWRKQENARKASISAFMDYAKAFDCGLQQTVENPYSDGNNRPSYLPPEKPADSSRINRTGHGTMERFQTGKVYVKAVYCHLAYLTYMQSTS